VKDADKVPFVLVGNKCDKEDEREVPTEKGQNFASELGCPFLEASAKNRKNVVETFEAIVREVNKTRNNPSVQKSGETNDSGKTKERKRKRSPCNLL